MKSVINIERSSLYYLDGRIYRKIPLEKLEIDTSVSKIHINLLDLEEQIADGIIYSDNDGIIYKFGAKKIIQKAITNGLEIRKLDEKYQLNYYSFWVPDLYFYSKFKLDSSVSIATKNKDLFMLSNIYDNGLDFTPREKSHDFEWYKICLGSLNNRVKSYDEDEVLSKIEDFVNRIISGKPNADLEFINNKIKDRGKCFRDLTELAKFYAKLTLEQENVNTYEEFLEWSKTTDLLRKD